MATYKLIPSSWAGGETITDPSNAYADTTSTTYAGVKAPLGQYAYLGGFDFSVIPQGYIVTGLTVKIKAQGTSATLYSDVGGTNLSSSISISSVSLEVSTFSLNESIETILGYSSTLCIRIFSPYQNPSSVYGAEINVEAFKPRNKIIYGNETLIDLTSDTATASDVAVGKTFHLASGAQATGTYDAAPIKKTVQPTGSTSTSISFSGLTKEPSWFVVLCMAAGVTRNYRVYSIVYDGTRVSTQWDPATGYGRVSSDWESTNPSYIYSSFTYSSGTLTISLKEYSNKYFGNNVIYWLYYL